MNGDRWKLPDGREGVEIDQEGSLMKIVPIRPDWPFPGLPEWVPKKGCKKQPSRYLHETMEDAPW